MLAGATAAALAQGFYDHIGQSEAYDPYHGVKNPEENSMVGQEPGNVLGQHAVDGFSVTYHGSPVVIMVFFSLYPPLCGQSSPESNHNPPRPHFFKNDARSLSDFALKYL
jgi:hypothetical protein